ncbi:hypothetical protein MTO96_020139 [Rhipicephalus appendiculatus]
MDGTRRMKDDPNFGVDSRWSWITAFFCTWVMFLTMATPRIAGIFFYGIVEAFGVTRAEAMWPVSLAGSFSVLGGTSLCGLFVACNVLLAQHFEKRRATASSLVYAVFGLNSILLSPLIEFFRTTYGVHGAFLIYGAILLNMIPPVIVLRSPPWLMTSRIAKKWVPAEDNEINAVCVLSQPLEVDHIMAEKFESHYSYRNQDSDSEQSAESAAREQKLLPVTSYVPNEKSLKLNVAVLASAAFFTIIPADLAKDRGLSPSDAVYVLQAFSAADIAFKAVTGVAVDSCALSHESVMIVGYVVQVLAYEWLAWAETFPHLMAVSILMGATYGSRWCLQAPILVKDFGITALPAVMGGVLFSGGVALLLRPVIIAKPGLNEESTTLALVD